MRSHILVYNTVSSGLAEVLLDQVVHRRFPIRIGRTPLDGISSCGQREFKFTVARDEEEENTSGLRSLPPKEHLILKRESRSNSSPVL